MKRLIASVAVLALCFSISVVLMPADPGNATTSDGTTFILEKMYPPPPDGYEGIWPPEWMAGLDGDDPSDTGNTDTTNTGDPEPWGDPHQ